MKYGLYNISPKNKKYSLDFWSFVTLYWFLNLKSRFPEAIFQASGHAPITINKKKHSNVQKHVEISEWNLTNVKPEIIILHDEQHYWHAHVRSPESYPLELIIIYYWISKLSLISGHYK